MASAESPFIILTVIGFVSSLLPLLLPETAEETLPDTIEEANNFGQNQGFFDIPILNRYLRRKKSNEEEKRTNSTIDTDDASISTQHTTAL